MKIAIIPARSGSKRIKGKNIKKFCGKPIIYFPINAAKRTNLFDRIIVSTDSKKIASLAKSLKVEAPFLRPAKLSGDNVSTTDVVKHAIKWLKKRKCNPTYVCCIYPTAVFAKSNDIKKSYKEIKKGNWNYVFLASSIPSKILRSFRKIKNNGVRMIFPKNYNTRSQDLEPLYCDVGQFYWGRVRAWLSRISIFSNLSTIVTTPWDQVCDIDTLHDWSKAEEIYKMVKKK
tara:strand:- start:2045 stop:2734 length:690 start_codon:yes stop_codon:yes gene_type:complete